MSDSLLFNVLIVAYFVTTLVYAFTVFSKKKWVMYLSRALLLISLHVHTAVMIERWWEAGRPPMSNMFETLIFFAWSIAVVYLAVEIKYGLRILGPAAGVASLLSLAYATLIFPDTIEPLMPALQNNFWLTIHVSFCFVAYGALSVSYIVSLLHLMRRTDWHKYAAGYAGALTLVVISGGLVAAYLQRSGAISLSLNAVTVLSVVLGGLVAGAIITPAVLAVVRFLKLEVQFGDSDVLDTVLYRTITFGFLFLAIGIITGSVWAHQAWGRYWGWDPKETWSLITWLIYGIYLHIRFGWGKKGVGTVWLAVLGFWAVVFTYFGVNFLLAGLHSYA